jgi:hypothetical protein
LRTSHDDLRNLLVALETSSKGHACCLRELACLRALGWPWGLRTCKQQEVSNRNKQ